MGALEEILTNPKVIGLAVNTTQGFLAKGKADEQTSIIEANQKALQDVIDSRQEITNPYQSVSAYKPTDNSDMFKNPYENLRVATKAAEIQMEQTDIALANTLDTLRVSGMGAGGATALAQAAAQGKQGIAASIEQQEINNQKLKAQGEAQVQAQKAAEKARVQGIEASEQGRVQAAQAAGEQFMFAAQETRTNADLDRAQQEVDTAKAQQLQYQSDSSAAFGQVASGLMGMTDLTGQTDKKASMLTALQKSGFDLSNLSI